MQQLLDRTTPPPIHPFENFGLPPATISHLDNGVELYLINCGDVEVSRLDIMFTAGSCDEVVPLAAEMTNALLKEGARGINSAQIAEQLDFVGAWLQPYVSRHNSYMTLYSLNKYFEQSVELLANMVLYPTFPEAEFETIVGRRKQQLRVSMERVENIAAREFYPYYFGSNHPYGKKTELTHYDQLTTDHLRQYHTTHYTPNKCKIVITGKVTPRMVELINSHFGQQTPNTTLDSVPTTYTHQLPKERELLIPKDGAVQSAIRMAIPSVGREHPHYNQMRVLNALFGGYFGSRLMGNIREEKGYTYGIGSSIMGLPHASFIMITTQTGNEYRKEVVKEVLHEAKRLCEELVPIEELETVKNYLAGDLARLFDGAFPIADAYISLIANNLPSDYYNKQLNDILNVTSQELQQLAQHYLQPDSFYGVIVG